MNDCQPCVVSKVLFTTAKHCPQRWPKKDGTPYWRCKDPITHFMGFADNKGGAVCDRHLAYYTDCQDAEAA